MAESVSTAHPSWHSRHATLVANGLIHAINDGYVAAIYPILPMIAAEFGASLGEVGLVKLGLTGALGLFELPAGLLAERVGENLVLTVGTAWLAAGFLALGLAGVFWQVIVLAVFAGAGGAPQHPLSASLVSKAYPASQRNTAIGTLNFSGDIGKAIVPLLGGWLAVAIGWRQAVICLGLAGLPLVAVFAWLSRGGARTAGASAQVRPTSGGWGIADWPRFNALLVLGILDSAVRGAALTLLPFLLVGKGFDTPTIALLFGLLFAAGAAGKFGCGPLADRFGPVGVVIVTEALTAAALVALVPATAAQVYGLVVLFGFFLNGTSSILYAAVAGLVREEQRARGYALYYMFTLVAGAVAPVLFGLAADRWSLPLSFALMAAAAMLTLPFARLLRTARPAC